MVRSKSKALGESIAFLHRQNSNNSSGSGNAHNHKEPSQQNAHTGHDEKKQEEQQQQQRDESAATTSADEYEDEAELVNGLADNNNNNNTTEYQEDDDGDAFDDDEDESLVSSASSTMSPAKRRQRQRERQQQQQRQRQQRHLGSGGRGWRLDDKLGAEAAARYQGNYVKFVDARDFDAERHWAERGFTEPLCFANKAGLGMRVPSANFQVSDVKACVGSNRDVDVIDVRTQRGLTMSMREWCDYYEAATSATWSASTSPATSTIASSSISTLAWRITGARAQLAREASISTFTTAPSIRSALRRRRRPSCSRPVSVSR